MVYRLKRDRIELLKFATAAGWEGREAGAALFAKLVYKLASHRRQFIVVDVRPEWRTADVRALASGISPPLPILADALQEAGAPEWVADVLRGDDDEAAGALYRALRMGGLLSK